MLSAGAGELQSKNAGHNAECQDRPNKIRRDAIMHYSFAPTRKRPLLKDEISRDAHTHPGNS